MKKWLNLENLIYLTIFLLPSYLIKINFFGVPTNVLEILTLVIFGWALIKKRANLNFLKPRLQIALVLILAGLIISTILNKHYLVGLGIIKGWFVLPFLLAVVAKNTIPTEKRINIYWAIYFSATGIALISLGYYLQHKLTFDGRLQGIFNSPNYLAMYLAPAIVIGAANFRKNAKHIFSFGIVICAFFLTYSYAAWIAIMLTVIIVAILRGEIILKKSGWVGIILLLLILAQWNSQKFMDLRNFSERSSINSRVMIWKSAGNIIKDNWIFGIGPGNFQEKYLEYQPYFSPYLEWAVPHPHNLLLGFWLYSGLVGLIGFGILIYAWLKRMWQKEKDILWWMSFGIMVYFLLHGLVDTTYFKNDLAAIFWVNFLVLL